MIAEDCLGVLHRTLRADPSAFGLRDAAYTAGERLTTVMDTLAAGRDTSAGGPPDPDGSDARTDFAARLVRAVGGEGGTVADAAVRRAAAATAERLAAQHPEALAADGKGWSGDLLCLIYQWFFADVVAEFLRGVIAEKIKIAVPVLPLADPEDHVADWVAEQVMHLVPNPCEEAEHLKNAVEQAEDAISAFEDPPVGTLAQVARGLVPRAVGAALGLLTPSGSALEEGPDAAPSEGTPAA
ncbi:hypothetical protein G5C60_27735 [Streptomyces sp. HC44]|uniref:Uncharacterized protein n=1 Tax=Streptomyces scabichelini TaxID=2711217 RepID=A0A6G4VBW0_9ACTN|nr:hypothetical protein [Streptomyces scabichelini]NGO11293.1 hypothetical protein [Streptomyces scabichelini]